MGDTGSLALGACFAGMAMILGNVWVLLAFGAVYVLEACSVMIQVGYYKMTRLRWFKMAPLHHHFELCGIEETAVVRLFWFIGIMFVMLFFWMN